MKPVTLDVLRRTTLVRSLDRNFATGRRRKLRYALASEVSYYARINPSGPDPADFIAFARDDLSSGSPSAPFNALTNAKRAVHQAVDALLPQFALDRSYLDSNLPTKLTLLEEIGALPTRLVAALNQRRNLMEHAYTHVKEKEARDFLEVAELFVTVCYTFFRRSVLAAYVGILGSDLCYEYRLHLPSSTIGVNKVEATESLASDEGPIHFHMRKSTPRQVLETHPIERSNRGTWLPLIDLLVYVTRMDGLRLPDGPPGMIGMATTEFAYNEEVQRRRLDEQKKGGAA